MLGGVEGRVIRGERGKKRYGNERELRREEIGRVLRTMKNGKAAGLDEVPGEVWKYGGEKVEEWI